LLGRLAEDKFLFCLVFSQSLLLSFKADQVSLN